MGKTVFMFPGQGAQYIGMGSSFAEEFECSSKIFDIASEAVGIDIKDLCFNENDRINKTEYTQIALYTTEVAILKALEEKGYKSDVNVGLSLGEYAAITASKALDFADGCKIVRKRGIYMEQEVPDGKGSMAAILGLTADKVESVLNDSNAGNVSIANYNCPGQIVISGEKQAVLSAMDLLKEAGAKRAIELNVSGPFHSQMLKGAGDKLADVLKDIEFSDIEKPYIANLTAEYVTDRNSIKDLLIKQVYSSVRMEQSIRLLLNDGADTFIEVGPGRTLTGFVKKTARDMEISDIKLVNIEKTQDL